MPDVLSRVLRPGTTSMGGPGAGGTAPPDVEVDVAVSWKGEPLLRRRVREGDTAWVGDVEGSWVRIPCERIGVEGFRLARVKRGEAMVLAPRGARGRLERPDGTVELFGSGREVWLLPGDVVRMRIGSFSIAVSGVAVSGARASAAGRRLRGLVRRFPGGQLGLSAVFHVAVLVVALVWPANEERAATEQAAALTESEVAAFLDVGAEVTGDPVGLVGGTGAERADVVGPPGPEAPMGAASMDVAAKPEAATASEGGAELAGGEGEARPAMTGARQRSSGETEAPREPTPWGWLMGGALAMGGWGALRWRRSRARAGVRGRWSWAGVVELGRWVTGGDRVGVLGVEVPGVQPPGSELGQGSLDVVALGEEAVSRGGELQRAWGAVRAGGVLVVGAGSGGGGGLVAERVRKETGAAVVWWFERREKGRGELQTVVMAVKGRPVRGPREVLERGPVGASDGGDALAIAAGFKGWAPFEDGGVVEAEGERLVG